MRTLEQIKEYIRTGHKEKFYHDRYWGKLAKEVLEEQHFECQECKKRGIYTRATLVHHVKHLEEFPELAYSKTYIDESGNVQKNLEALCFNCHEAQHPDRLKPIKPKPQLNKEWFG